MRYNADGSLDTGFGGGDGIVTTSLSAGDDKAHGLALQADGKIIVVGETSTNGNDFAVLRYNADGSLDSSFGGGDGIVTTDFAGGSFDLVESIVDDYAARIRVLREAPVDPRRMTLEARARLVDERARAVGQHAAHRGGQWFDLQAVDADDREALGREVVREGVARRAEADDRVAVIILAGNGPSFSAGHDMGTQIAIDEELPGPAQHSTFRIDGGTAASHVERRTLQEWHYYFECTRRWRDLRKITIAQVHGNVISRDEGGFNGPALLQNILESGLRFGEMDIFHRHESMAGNGEVLFSMANGVKPGTFDLDDIDLFSTRAVSFFLGMPGPRHPKQAFDVMLAAVRKLAHELNGELKDDQRSVMTAQTIEHYRQRIVEFERKHMMPKR